MLVFIDYSQDCPHMEGWCVRLAYLYPLKVIKSPVEMVKPGGSLNPIPATGPWLQDTSALAYRIG